MSDYLQNASIVEIQPKMTMPLLLMRLFSNNIDMQQRTTTIMAAASEKPVTVFGSFGLNQRI